MSREVYGQPVRIRLQPPPFLHPPCQKSLRNLSDVDPLEWPTVKLVRKRITDSEYQGTKLKHFNDIALESCKDQALTDVSHLEDRSR